MVDEWYRNPPSNYGAVIKVNGQSGHKLIVLNSGDREHVSILHVFGLFIEFSDIFLYTLGALYWNDVGGYPETSYKTQSFTHMQQRGQWETLLSLPVNGRLS